MKINRNGQSEIFSQRDWVRFKKELRDPYYKTLILIAHYTGERMGAVRQLMVEDVYGDFGLPRSEIIFKKKTRKGQQATRQIAVHPELDTQLRSFRHPVEGYLFRGGINHDSESPISFQAIAQYLSNLFNRLGLDGFSTHSFRRGFITNLYRNGVGLREIQAITGHSSLESLARYVEHDPERQRRAILSLE